ncbi:hypothetical protein BJI67_04860 [Acidihalobacter aeolianus]|uniref:diguanylate cyclase n=1 Tax=Acidihalobacter aeolianus TaxID=2792603 RepID=A0A1D8K6C8_9GAMM|nr:GGDEF domain-containing protein [Acidihalobacter aeolianus]AOV16490.1 hypothetical protein BJI67_04860 [Acidihalobacter aeolianus]
MANGDGNGGLSGEVVNDDGYRERYRQLVQEFDAAEAEWKRDRAVGMQLLANMILRLSGAHPDLAGVLKSFGDALQAGRFEADAASLSSMIETLPIVPGPAAAETGDIGSLVRAVVSLEALTDSHSTLPGELHDLQDIERALKQMELEVGERLRQLRTSLETLAVSIYEAKGWPRQLDTEREEQRSQFAAGDRTVDADKLAGLLGRGFQCVEQERNEIRCFLADLIDRLDVLERTFGEGNDRRRDLLRQAGEVNRQIESSVRDLMTESQVATDFDSLRAAIDARLHNLTDDLLTLRGLGDDMLHQSDVDAAKLTERLKVLEVERDQLSRRLEQTYSEARVDSLTALPNRRAIDERLEEEVARVRRSGGDFSIALVDVDHFKQINDRYGHASGDRALQIIARLLSVQLRRSDVVGRWGGEEFLFLFPGASAETAREVVDRVRRGLCEAPTHFKGERVSLSASFGIATWEGEADTSAALMQRADEALYAAKQAGRNALRG